MDVSIILPSYLEAENLKTILPAIKNNLNNGGFSYEIIVVDTIEKMDETDFVCEKNGVNYIHRENGNSYGDAVRTGISCANGTYCVFMDSDGSHNSKDIIEFYNQMTLNNYDLVIGSRYCKGGFTDNSFILRAMSRILNITYTLVFGLRIKDISNSFRMYKTADLKKLNLECNNFDVVEEILIQLIYTNKNYYIKEVPIVFNKRDKGESKRNLVKFCFSYLSTMKRLLQVKNKYNSK